MDETVRVVAVEVLGLAPFWYLFASSNRGRFLGIKRGWSVLRMREPWRQRVLWAAMGGTLLVILGLLADGLLPSTWLLVGGCVLVTGLFSFLAWAVLLDPKRRLAFEVPDEGVLPRAGGEV